MKYLQTAEKPTTVNQEGQCACLAMDNTLMATTAQMPATTNTHWRQHAYVNYLRWLVLFAAGALLLSGLISYGLWLNNVSAARHKYLQTRLQMLSDYEAEEIERLTQASNAPNSAQIIKTTAVQSQAPSTLLRAIAAPAPSPSAAHIATTTSRHTPVEFFGAHSTKLRKQSNNGQLDAQNEQANSARFHSAQSENSSNGTDSDHLQRPSAKPSLSITLAKVSPTLPPLSYGQPSTTMSSAAHSTPSQDNGCQSTSLPMCQSVLDYDLTSSSATELSALEQQQAYAALSASNCSARAMQFLCTLLEPECRPSHIGVLLPCRRICKSIYEACSIVIANSDTLAAIFDCGLYPDSPDPQICVDPTRHHFCYANEFACDDRSCISQNWQCDNIKDCAAGEDEENCLLCAPDEFRCRSNEKCISELLRCDRKFDCADASDEENCDDHIYKDDAAFNQDAYSLYPDYVTSNEKTSNYNATTPSNARSTFYLHGTPYNQSAKEMSGEVANVAASENISQGFVYFRDSKEIMMTSDSENKFKYSPRANRTYIKSSSTMKSIPSTTTATERAATAPTKAPHLQSNVANDEMQVARCAPHQLRCVSGHCITVQQICDKKVDCPDGADELMCVYKDTSASASANRPEKQAMRKKKSK